MADTARIDEENRREIAAMNRGVIDRLERDGAVQRLCDARVELFGVADFFSDAECERLMGLIDAVARPSPVFDVDQGRAARTSFSGDMNPQDPFIRMLHRRLDDLIGAESEWGETMQGQRYGVGQEFKAHHDWFSIPPSPTGPPTWPRAGSAPGR